ncbi:hypothetical protein [uncultured Paraglaciecola sp.]|nr:hypothetical protein [uncultured Paraglaciecola sp.]
MRQLITKIPANFTLARAEMRSVLNLEKTEVTYQMEVQIDCLHRRVFDI